MAIDNETSLYTADNVLSTVPNEELRNQNKDTATETATQPTTVTPTTTTSAPVFNRDQRVALTLLPLASALLQGKTQGGQSQLSGLLASAGQGLAGSANAALQIAQLEAQSAKTKTTTPKQYVLQEGFKGKVDVGGTQYSKADNIIFNFTPEQINAYPQGTFVEYTKPKTDADATKKVDVREDFTINGVTYKKGKGIPILESVIAEQTKINPAVFGSVDTTNLSAVKPFIFDEEVTVTINGQEITIPEGKQLVAPELVTAVNQQIGVGKVKEAPKEGRPDSFTKQLNKVKGILNKVTDESNTLKNKVDVLSDEDIFDLKAYADKIGKKQTYTIIENGVTKTFEETPIDIFNNYKIAYGETAYKDLLERIFLGKEGSRALEQELVKLEGDSPRNFIMNFDEAEVALGDKKKLLSQSVKPLSGTDAQKLASAESALKAVENAKSVIFDNEGNIRTGILAAPGSRFYEAGRKKQYYRRAIRMATEILLRARSGAAVPESEFQRYDKMYVPSIFDAPEVAKMKIIALENEFVAIRGLLDSGRGQDLQKGVVYNDDGTIKSMSPLSGANEGLDLNNNESFQNKAKTDDGFSGNN